MPRVSVTRELISLLEKRDEQITRILEQQAVLVNAVARTLQQVATPSFQRQAAAPPPEGLGSVAAIDKFVEEFRRSESAPEFPEEWMSVSPLGAIPYTSTPLRKMNDLPAESPTHEE